MKEYKPKIFKWKKLHNKILNRKLKKKNYKHFYIYKGILGLKALESEVISSKELKTIFSTMLKKCGRQYKIWLYCYPNYSFTSKSISVRMGKGVGSVDPNWLYCIKKNTMFIEFSSKTLKFLKKGIISCKKKLKISCRMVQKNKKWKI